MAKRILSWLVDGPVLKAGEYKTDIDGNILTVFTESFDLIKMFPGFNEFNEAQKYIVIYGLKQKLADIGSSLQTWKEKIEQAERTWKLLIENKISSERSNGTKAAETKKFVASVKSIASECSLNGLSMKKMLTPELFTEEDEAKLMEFYQEAMKLAARMTAEKRSKAGTKGSGDLLIP